MYITAITLLLYYQIQTMDYPNYEAIVNTFTNVAIS